MVLIAKKTCSFFDTRTRLWYINSMQNEDSQTEVLTPEVLEVMRNFVSAIRAVKLYPANNPIYTQSIKKSLEVLDRFLEATPDYSLAVHTAHLSYHDIPISKETQVDKTVVHDLFAKGVREIIFKNGVTEDELTALFRALAMSSEEIAMKSGLSVILWEHGVTRIKVTESGLDEVIRSKPGGGEEKPKAARPARSLDQAVEKKEIVFGGRTLVLGDLMNDPAGFGAGMLSLATETRGEYESVEDRLYALYQEGGRKIREEDPDQSDILFEGLAQSVLSLESPYREKIVTGKLYRDLDEDSINEQKEMVEEQVPNELHEILTGRFSDSCTVPQISELLKRSSTKPIVSPPPPPAPPTAAHALEVVPLPENLADLARDMAEYTPEEMDSLQRMNMMGMESDVLEASVRTLLFLLLLVKNPHRHDPEEKKIELFSRIVRQLEDMLNYVLIKKDYKLAVQIGQAFRMTVDPVFQPRMKEALWKMVSPTSITEVLGEMRQLVKSSSDYAAAYSYLSLMERETTKVLLELLAEEKDRQARIFYLDLAKELAKSQIMLIGEHLSDERWYFVRNIVSILGESKDDQAITLLNKVARHNNVRIRQEVIKGLISIGGSKAANVLVSFLNDKDAEIQLMAVRGLAGLKGPDSDVAKTLVEFLNNRPLKKGNQELTVEVIGALGKIGGADAAAFLEGYRRIKWWKSRSLQQELRTAALRAMGEIKRRGSDGGRTAR